MRRGTLAIAIGLILTLAGGCDWEDIGYGSQFLYLGPSGSLQFNDLAWGWAQDEDDDDEEWYDDWSWACWPFDC